ncbi:unnamed protein product [Darwinula stevensoni]|uniref:Uncharacterized protein n=1 Tax=Darwinula stevensoni TaxID=69355 RepID=A0A7R8X888_9CRUS|nr:unnamed protein product [Darwinula stevensoni]CAG0884189.1 unnamed protein product [Darwinula stevensoni]
MKLSRFFQIVEIDEIVLLKEFTESPKDTKVYLGDVARFRCQIASVPPATLKWERDRLPLPQNSRYLVTSSGTLEIHDVRLSDAGKFRCVARNEALDRGRVSAEGTLSVSEPLVDLRDFRPPTFFPLPQHETGTQGENISLPCLALGSPSPTLSWARQDGKPLPRTAYLEGKGSLILVNVSARDTGIYECTASSQDPRNPSQIVMKKHILQLTVQVPPTFIRTPESVEHPIAKTIRFECEADGWPQPQIQWLKDGKPLAVTGRVKILKRNQLVLSNSVVEDAGIYQCVASNAAGVRMAAAKLQMQQLRPWDLIPQAPQNLRVQLLLPSAIILSWDPSHGPVIAYSAHYYPTETSTNELQKVVTSPHVTIDGLLPNINYTFYVRAYTNSSASPFSEKFIWSTQASIPSSLPDEVKLEAKGPHMLLVSWKLLPASVTQYKVLWRRAGSAAHNVEMCPGDTNRVLLNGLETDEEYEVLVLDGTKPGNPDVPWYRVRMPVLDGPLPPPTLSAKWNNATSIIATWKMPNNVVEPTQIKLWYRAGDGEFSKFIFLPGNSSSFLLTGLVSEMLHEVHLLAMVGQEEGHETIVFVPRYSPPPTPPPPPTPQASPISSSAILVKWEPDSKPVDFYTVHYHKVVAQGSEPNSAKHLTVTGHEVEVNELESSSFYAFCVQRHHEGKQSLCSQQVECQTLPDRPGCPESVAYQPVNESTVHVSWHHPAEVKRKEIIKYHILYSSDLRLPMEWKSLSIEGNNRMATVGGLKQGVQYLLRVQTETKAGKGPLCDPPLRIYLPIFHQTATPTTERTEVHVNGSYAQDDESQWIPLGVLVGVSTGLGVVLLGIGGFLVYKWVSRQRQRGRRQGIGGEWGMNGHGEHQVNTNTAIPHLHQNGSGKCHPSPGDIEMGLLTPMLPQGLSTPIANDSKKGGVVQGVNGISHHVLRRNKNGKGRTHLHPHPLRASQEDDSGEGMTAIT